ncbi:MAG TPA: nucleoside diphosphate kinase regulator [Bauldia sp.]|nr:nucleoside diphosphate kinase regulator [Bauldia sp.]
MQNTNPAWNATLIISDLDRRRLDALATAAMERSPDLADGLMAELDRATIVGAESMPADVIRMGSTATFRSGDGTTRRVTLVFPADADIASGRVSVLTPVGTALIGLSEGQSITWTTRDGREQQLTVLEVEPQAPAA